MHGVPVPCLPPLQPTEARSRRRRRRWVVVVDPGLTPRARGDQFCLEPSMHSLAVPSRGLRLTCYRVGSVYSGPGPGTVQTGGGGEDHLRAEALHVYACVLNKTLRRLSPTWTLRPPPRMIQYHHIIQLLARFHFLHYC